MFLWVDGWLRDRVARDSYDGTDCSAAIELKPAKTLPAITNFFKKKGKEEEKQPLPPCGIDTGVGATEGVFRKGGVKVEEPPLSGCGFGSGEGMAETPARSVKEGNDEDICEIIATKDAAEGVFGKGGDKTESSPSSVKKEEEEGETMYEIVTAAGGSGRGGGSGGNGGSGSSTGGDGAVASPKAGANVTGAKRRAVHTLSPKKKGRGGTTTPTKSGGSASAKKKGSPRGGVAADGKQKRMTSFFRPTT